MVVLMTIALLIAIALPTLAGFRDKGQAQGAQSTLATAERVGYLVVLEEGRSPEGLPSSYFSRP